MSLKRRNARTVECSPPIDLDASTAGHVLMFSPIRADGTAIAVPAGDILQHTAFTLKVYANR
jgi:hypothetical protein